MATTSVGAAGSTVCNEGLAATQSKGVEKGEKEIDPGWKRSGRTRDLCRRAGDSRAVRGAEQSTEPDGRGGNGQSRPGAPFLPVGAIAGTLVAERAWARFADRRQACGGAAHRPPPRGVDGDADRIGVERRQDAVLPRRAPAPGEAVDVAEDQPGRAGGERGVDRRRRRQEARLVAAADHHPALRPGARGDPHRQPDRQAAGDRAGQRMAQPALGALVRQVVLAQLVAVQQQRVDAAERAAQPAGDDHGAARRGVVAAEQEVAIAVHEVKHGAGVSQRCEGLRDLGVQGTGVVIANPGFEQIAQYIQGISARGPIGQEVQKRTSDD